MTTAPPPGILLRAALPADADLVARVHVRAWQAAYRGLLPDAYLDGLRAEDRARHYTFGARDAAAPQTIVARLGEELVGFATVRPVREEPAVGELAALYVDPLHWGRRVGLLLIEAARAHLAAAGFASARLWLLAGNERAGRFYRIDGWTPDGTRRSEIVWGVSVDELGFRRPLP